MSDERSDGVVLVVVVVVSVLLVAVVWQALVSPVRLIGAETPSRWYFRLRNIQVAYEVLPLGALAYVVRAGRWTKASARVGALGSALGIAATLTAWFLEPRALPFEASGPISRGFAHVAAVVVYVAVIAWWLMVERTGGSAQEGTTDFA